MALTETSDWYLEEMAETDPVASLAAFVERDSLYRMEDRVNKQGVFDLDPVSRQAFLHERAQEFLDAVVSLEESQTKEIGRASLYLFSQSES